MNTEWTAAIDSVELRELRTHADDRGALTELMRESWMAGTPPPVQFNYVRSLANVLRGVHLHVRHWDYLIVPEGKATIGLVDLRPRSTTFRKTQVVRMRGDAMCLLTIPPGVAHGFHFTEAGVFLYGLSDYWDPVNDELACQWDDPALGLDWGIPGTPVLSERDASAGPLSAMLAQARAIFTN